MHLLIPFAFCSSDGCQKSLSSLSLPHLEKLLSRLTPEPLDVGDAFSLSTPHERALARALGLPTQDGLIPWAALHAKATAGAWAFITPCHWQVGANHITMSGQTLPDFSAQESQALLAAMQPYFEEDGIALLDDQPTRWLARGDIFDGLATASLDRVAGRNLDHWMPRSAQAAPLRRLQSEMQMLLYTHPVNDARTARGALPVNSFWVSGSGALPTTPLTTLKPAPSVTTRLCDPALNEDWTAWAQAWQALDATECAALLTALNQGENCQLTLCGERHAQTFVTQPQTLLKKLTRLFSSPASATFLETL